MIFEVFLIYLFEDYHHLAFFDDVGIRLSDKNSTLLSKCHQDGIISCFQCFDVDMVVASFSLILRISYCCINLT